MNYSQQERARAASWKQTSPELPDAAREDAPYARPGFSQDRTYPFCLPRDYAAHTLLPDVRDLGRTVFRDLNIPWHAGVDGGPSNHLLSSQVQCVNALGRMVDEPERIKAAFGGVVTLGDITTIESGRYLTFEYVPPEDFLDEGRGRPLTRGANCTSVDAAFRHTLNGKDELVLVEWKYTEAYRPRTLPSKGDEERRRRYGHLIEDPTGPVRGDLLPMELLFDEPIYQLVRQQLLAHQMELNGVADRVRVVHVLSPQNESYQRSLARPEHRALSPDVSGLWQQLLRHADRFTTLDPAVFLSPAITSPAYAGRYGGSHTDAAGTVSAKAPAPATEGGEDVVDEVIHPADGSLSAASARSMAAAVGVPESWAQPGLAQKFFYFADATRLVVVVGEQSGNDADKALAYGMTWRADRQLVLVLPRSRTFATTQRAAWFRSEVRPVVYAHDGSSVLGEPLHVTKGQTVQRLLAAIPQQDPVVELRKATTPLHLGVHGDLVAELQEWATAHDDLTPAHRQSYRAWHHQGQSVLQLTRAPGGVQVRAGIGDSAAAFGTVRFRVGPDGLGEQLSDSIRAVEKGVRARQEGGAMHRADEHWLQAVLRDRPRLAGVEEPALREVPAWRPSPDTSVRDFNRGYVDLLGLDSAGDLRVVETKLASADDPMLILQGLDYVVWATAYAQALRDRLGANPAAPVTLCYLVGSAGPKGDAVVFSRYAQAQLDAIDRDAVSVTCRGLVGWFGADADIRPVVVDIDPGNLPTKAARPDTTSVEGL